MKPTDMCRCGHSYIEHRYGKDWTTKEGYYRINILKNGGGRCSGDDLHSAPGEPGPCGCPKFNTTPYK
jgi:hypothetical protein